jgi:hypothetical protein
MNRAEQLTRELYMIHKTGQHATAYAVARIIALEELLRQVLVADEDGWDSHETNLSRTQIQEIKELVPDESTFDNADPDSTEPTDG